MDCFFSPQGIAVIGATPNRLKGGNAIVRNLIAGYRGPIYPVNPRYNELEGFPCFPTVGAIPDRVDLAIVFVPAHQVPEAVNDCASAGVRGIMIESGGFAETGPEGLALQQKMLEISRKHRMRLWGPNCMGLVDFPRGHIFSFMDPGIWQDDMIIPGTISLIVQSGMLSAGFLVDIMSHGTMGISKACSIGNKMDVDESDLLSYLIADPATEVIGLYLESIVDGRRFTDLCRSSEKPIVLLKGGKSAKGAIAAMSHTASLAGNHRIIAGALAQAGVVEAQDFKQMMDFCRSLAMAAPTSVKRNRLAILTFSGGAGIVSADLMSECGLEVADLSPATTEILQQLFPPWMPVANPIDLWPALERNIGTDTDVYGQALKAVLQDPKVDAVLIHTLAGIYSIRVNLADVAAQMRLAGKPVFIWLMGKREEAFRFLTEARTMGVPTFQELSRAIECLNIVLHRRKMSPKPAEVAISTPAPGKD